MPFGPWPGVVSGGGSGATIAAKAIATSDITPLSGEQSVDGVFCSAGDLVVAAAQNDPAGNWIYIVGGAAWQPISEANLQSGTLIIVREGALYGPSLWNFRRTGSGETTRLMFAQFDSTTQQRALTRAQQLLGPTVNTCLGTDFENDQFYVNTLVNGGTSVLSASGRAGVLLLSTNALANAQANIRQSGGSGGNDSYIDNPQTTRWFFRVAGRIATAVDAQTQLLYEISNNSGNPHIAFGVRGSHSTAMFTLEVTTNAGVVTSLVTTKPIDNLWHLFDVANNGTVIEVFIDGVSFGTVPSTAVGTNPCIPFVFSFNGTTAANPAHELDFMWFCMPGNQPA